MKQDTVLIVDDVEMNREILAEIFKSNYKIIEAENGKEAIQKLADNFQSVAVILLDIIMPGMDGYQVMDLLKKKNIMSRIPIVLITGDTSEDMERRAYNIGVADIIHKPFDAYLVKRRISNIIELYQHKNNMEQQISRQTNKLQEQNVLLQKQAEMLQAVNNVMIDTMSNLVEFRNMESGQHVKRIKKFTRCLSESIAANYPEYALDEEKIQIIEQASAMHDIGKIVISDSILLKPGKLTKEEFQIMKTHTSRGCEIIESIMMLQGQEYYDYCYQICRFHHERYDGVGYPDGLKGEEIPIAAQIVSVADVYDALVSERVYKEAFKKDVAYRMIVEGECGIFSPKLIFCLEQVKEQFERLADELIDKEE